jgi:LPLT family lysophospholipid transporter-like MFS transporter
MIGLYTLTVRAGTPIVGIAALFGAGLAITIGALWLHRVRSRSQGGQAIKAPIKES